jgi:hypothetical protein
LRTLPTEGQLVKSKCGKLAEFLLLADEGALSFLVAAIFSVALGTGNREIVPEHPTQH